MGTFSEFHMSVVGLVLHHQDFHAQNFHFIWFCGSSHHTLACLVVRRKEAGRDGVVLSASMFPDIFCKDKFHLHKKEIEKYRIINIAHIVYFMI